MRIFNKSSDSYGNNGSEKGGSSGDVCFIASFPLRIKSVETEKKSDNAINDFPPGMLPFSHL